MRWYDGSNHMLNYEMNRLGQFKGANPGYYSNENLRHAYYEWSEAPTKARRKLWDTYCDIRDGFELGTNAAHWERFKQQPGPTNELRYIVK